MSVVSFGGSKTEAREGTQDGTRVEEEQAGTKPKRAKVNVEDAETIKQLQKLFTLKDGDGFTMGCLFLRICR